jgi:hypothetical protein
MESDKTLELSLVEYMDGGAIECAPVVLEELRRISVDGFLAFGHGGLEIGGVLYGMREGNRLCVLAFAELECEHALGPAFVLSDNDRTALAQLLNPPAGLETIGWFRSHTRTSLTLDASDREQFDHFGIERCAGLVLKPTHWGSTAAAFYVRDAAGEILPLEPNQFTIEAPGRKQEEPDQPESLAGALQPVEGLAPADFPEAQKVLAPRWSIPQPAGRLKLAASLLCIAALAVYFWHRPSNKLGLQAFAVTPGQVRIEWNHNALPVMNGASGSLQILDGDTKKNIPLDRDQLHMSSIVYLQRNSRIAVRMHVDPAQPGRTPADEEVEFLGTAAPPSQPAAESTLTAPVEPPVRPQIEERSRMIESVAVPVTAKPQQTPLNPSLPPSRKFQPSFPRRNEPAPREAMLPAAPLSPITTTLDSTLPDILRTPLPVAVRPAPQAYTGPRSGRLIWTGDLDRRGVIEIEHDHASIGSLSGSLCSVAAAYHIVPAEFTRGGLVAYTREGAASGRREPPSKSNGWNPVEFVYDPARAAELVVLEQPSQVNNFGRLVLRNDVRTYHVVVIDWTAR